MISKNFTRTYIYSAGSGAQARLRWSVPNKSLSVHSPLDFASVNFSLENSEALLEFYTFLRWLHCFVANGRVGNVYSVQELLAAEALARRACSELQGDDDAERGAGARAARRRVGAGCADVGVPVGLGLVVGPVQRSVLRRPIQLRERRSSAVRCRMRGHLEPFLCGQPVSTRALRGSKAVSAEPSRRLPVADAQCQNFVDTTLTNLRSFATRCQRAAPAPPPGSGPGPTYQGPDQYVDVTFATQVCASPLYPCGPIARLRD